MGDTDSFSDRSETVNDRNDIISDSTDGPPPQPDAEPNSDPLSRPIKLVAYGTASGVLFGTGLLLTESLGELAFDVDLKPFVLPYLLIAVTRFGLPTLSVGLGAALGEGILDIFEGYELDDPIGFLGYVFGFTVFGWYLHKVAEEPTSWRSLSVGAILGAFVQAFFEGAALFALNSAVAPSNVTVEILGNTVTHGIILGAIPLVFLFRAVPDLDERLRYFY